MLIVLSPAKTLDLETPPSTTLQSRPEFIAHSARLIDTLRAFSADQVGHLMDISSALSTLNVARYAAVKAIANPEKLKAFTVAGYAFDEHDSDQTTWLFRRRVEP